MIFLTLGTHEPFARLVRAVDEWCAGPGANEELFGQITERGADVYRPKNFQWVGRMEPAEYDDYFARAKLIVGHAGMGSILTALRMGKPIVVMPRRAHLREMRNDHQVATVKQLGSRPGIFVAEDETKFVETMDRALAALAAHDTVPISDTAAPEFTDALRSFLTGSR